MAIETSDSCIFCGPGDCQCVTKKKPARKARPKKKSEPSPPTGVGKTKPKPVERLAKPEHKGTARPERDQSNLINTERRRRSDEASEFWAAMTVLFNEGMLHEISVKRSLDAYPSIPGGLYE